MKTQLTAEQSAKLIEKGVSSDKASNWIVRQVTDHHGIPLEKGYLKRWKDCVPYEKSERPLNVGLTRLEHKDIFTLADLLSLLPTCICIDNSVFFIDITVDYRNWYVKYINSDSDSMDIILESCSDIELIDALYSLAMWCANNNYLAK